MYVLSGESIASFYNVLVGECTDSIYMFFQENAHFAIADMLISAFEQMKWETFLRQQSLMDNVTEESESDEEINELKQRICMRRRERLVEVGYYIYQVKSVLSSCKYFYEH